ncbi:MAG: hypothetical protein IJ896_00200 [Fibrobacter sp.]|nr:hypothetical protein [Fibrobacter sp.]
MEGRQLVLNDGTVIPDGEAGLSQGFLWLYLPGYTIQQAVAVAFDSNKTAVIVFEYGDMSSTYEGYTVCTSVSEDDGQASVCLTQA